MVPVKTNESVKGPSIQVDVTERRALAQEASELSLRLLRLARRLREADKSRPTSGARGHAGEAA